MKIVIESLNNLPMGTQLISGKSGLSLWSQGQLLSFSGSPVLTIQKGCVYYKNIHSKSNNCQLFSNKMKIYIVWLVQQLIVFNDRDLAI